MRETLARVDDPVVVPETRRDLLPTAYPTGSACDYPATAAPESPTDSALQLLRLRASGPA